MTGQGPLSFDALINDSNFMSRLDAMERRILGFTSSTVQQTSKIDAQFARLGQLAVGAFSLGKLAELPAQIFNVRKETEALEIAFVTMLKSKAKADALLGDLRNFEANTPFGSQEVAQGAKQLLAYGFAAKDIIPSLSTLGNISAGLDLPLSRLTYLFGTTKTQGRLFAQDLQQFLGSGIPLLSQLATQFSVSEEKVRELVTAGKVGFPEVKKALESLTTGGGIFAGTLDAQSKSLNGLSERLGSAYRKVLNNIGQQNQGIATDIINTATLAVEHYQELVDVLQVATATYGSYRAALLLANVYQREQALTAGLVAASVDKQTAANIANAASSLPALRAEVTALAAKKTEVIALATAQAVAAKAAQAELISAQAAAAAGATLLDAGKRNALNKAAEIAQNNVIAAQEAASLTRKQAIAVAGEFYATKTALQSAAVTAQTVAETRLTTAQAFRASITQRLTVLQTALNNSMLANPIVLIGTAIAGLAALYYTYREEVVEVKSAQDLLAQSTQEASSKFNTQKAEVSTLVGIIKNQNVAESERLKAYERLNGITPDILKGLDFQRAKTADLTKTTNEYLQSLEKKIKLEAVSGRFKEAFDTDAKLDADVAAARADFIRKLDIAKALEKARDKGLTGGGSAFNVGNDMLAQAKADANAALEQYNKLSAAKIKSGQTIKGISAELEGVYTGGSKDAIEAHIRQLEIAANALTDKLSPAYKQNEEALNGYRKQLAALNKAQAAGVDFSTELANAQTAAQLRVVKGIATTDNQLDALDKKVKELAGDATRGGKEKADLEKLGKEIDRLQGKRTAAEKKAARDAEKVGPLGSVSYYENIISKAEEALSKLNPKSDTDRPKIAQQLAKKIQAERNAEEARLAITARSFDEEIAYKREQYELYQKWVEAYGKQSADNQFSELLKSGQSYFDFLNAQIADLEKKREDGTLTKKGEKNLGNLLDDRNQIVGKKTAIDVFNEGLEKARTSAGNLAEYLVILKEKQDALTTAPKSGDDFKIRQQLAEEIVKTQAELQTRLSQFLVSYASSGEQQLSIQREFAEKRSALDARYNGNRGAEYKQALSVINTAEKQALEEFQRRKFEETEAYKKTTKVIVEEGRKGLKIQITNQRAAVDQAKKMFGTNSEIYKEEKQKLDGLIERTGSDASVIFGQYASVVGQFGDALSELGGTVGMVGGLISGLASNFGNLSIALKDNLNTEQKVQSVLTATVDIIGSITTAASQRKKAEQEYYRSVIAQQQQYNQLLNEQIGTRAEKDESIFFKDYEGRIKDRTAQYVDAQKEYMNSLRKLDEARVKVGQEDKVDWGAVGKNAASGAAAGAAIGGPIGAAIGGVAGLVVGLFGAKRKADEFASLLDTYPKLIQDGTDGQKKFNVVLAQTLIDTGMLDENSKQLVQTTIDWTKKMEEARAEIKNVIKDLTGGLGDKLRDNLVNAFKEGEDAAKAFSDAVGDIIGNLVEQMLFAQVLGPSLKKLQEEMEASASGGDGDFVDDITRFYQKAQADKLAEVYTASLAAIDEASKNVGIDVFKKSTSTAKAPNSLQGNISSLSESTGSALAGSLNAIRITQAQISETAINTNLIIRDQLMVLSGIERNTGKANQFLESMDRKLDALKSDSLRGTGLV